MVTLINGLYTLQYASFSGARPNGPAFEQFVNKNRQVGTPPHLGTIFGRSTNYRTGQQGRKTVITVVILTLMLSLHRRTYSDRQYSLRAAHLYLADLTLKNDFSFSDYSIFKRRVDSVCSVGCTL